MELAAQVQRGILPRALPGVPGYELLGWTRPARHVGGDYFHPVHLGILFIANLELGYLTPPAGLNLFLASSRFQRPLLAVYRAALPYLILNGIGVLLITYVPWLTTWLLPE